jgi:hypothetical protein
MIGSLTQWLPPAEAFGPVTCDACGCRLVRDGVEVESWHHFESLRDGEDARGCRPFCVNAAHDRFGRAIQDQAVSI